MFHIIIFSIEPEIHTSTQMSRTTRSPNALSKTMPSSKTIPASKNKPSPRTMPSSKNKPTEKGKVLNHILKPKKRRDFDETINDALDAKAMMFY